MDLRRCEPVRPIDPGAWVAHTNALLADATAGPPTPIADTPSIAMMNNNMATRRLAGQQQQHAMVYDFGATGGGLAVAGRRPGSAATGASSNNSGSLAATAMGEESKSLCRICVGENLEGEIVTHRDVFQTKSALFSFICLLYFRHYSVSHNVCNIDWGK